MSQGFDGVELERVLVIAENSESTGNYVWQTF